MNWHDIEPSPEESTPAQRRALHRFNLSPEIVALATKKQADELLKLFVRIVGEEKAKYSPEMRE